MAGSASSVSSGGGSKKPMRPEGPAQSRSAAPSVLIVCSILSRPDGRAYKLPALRAYNLGFFKNYAASGEKPLHRAAGSGHRSESNAKNSFIHRKTFILSFLEKFWYISNWERNRKMSNMQEMIPRVQTDQEQALDITALIEKVKDLPPLPTVVLKAMEMTLDPESSVRNLQLLISQDQALSAKILRIVNSAIYALRREVSTVSHAVAVLGMDTVRSVIMAASIEQVFQSAKALSTKLMSDHSWGTALAARAIARHMRYENTEEALVCGLMHDIGKPVLLQNLRERYSVIISEVYKGNSTFHQMELLAFGFSHAHVGALLARKWNFPPSLVEVVGYHHDPLSAPNFKQLACIVNLANLFMVSMEIGFEKDKSLDLAKQPSAEQLKLDSSAVDAIVSDLITAIQATAVLRA
jgi:putative nucleotidyltransferase with HDIG domain